MTRKAMPSCSPTSCNVQMCGCVNCADRARFLIETRAEFSVVRKGSRQNLESDVAIESQIASAIDFAHSAGAEEADNLYRPRRVPEESHVGRILARAAGGTRLQTDAAAIRRPAGRRRSPSDRASLRAAPGPFPGPRQPRASGGSRANPAIVRNAASARRSRSSGSSVSPPAST